MPRFTLLLGGKVVGEYSFAKRRITIGRHRRADIVIPNAAISRKHAFIEVVGDRCRIVDLQSTNGLQFNRKTVLHHPFRPGDVVYLGTYGLRFDGMGAADQRVAEWERNLGPEGSRRQTSGTGPQHTNVPQRDLDNSTARVMADTLTANAEERQQASLPRLTVSCAEGTQVSFVLNRSQIVIGKGESADVRLPGLFAPSVHSHVVHKRGGQVFIQTHRRWPRLRINGRKMSRATLTHGDVIDVGGIRIVVTIPEGAGGQGP